MMSSSTEAATKRLPGMLRRRQQQTEAERIGVQLKTCDAASAAPATTLRLEFIFAFARRAAAFYNGLRVNFLNVGSSPSLTAAPRPGGDGRKTATVRIVASVKFAILPANCCVWPDTL